MSQVCRRWRTVLISSALLWTQIDCQSLTRTIASLERHRSVPLRLELRKGFSNEALNTVLDHGSEYTSVFVYLTTEQTDLLHKGLVTSSMEEFVLFTDEDYGPPERITVDIRGEFKSLRRLLVSGFTLPIDHIEAPNLIHLALETSYPGSEYTANSILDMLRGCPQLETVLLNCLVNPTRIQQSYPPITLPNLRSVELGYQEIWAGLVIPLRFPPAVAVAFRGMCVAADHMVRESIQHVLAAIDIQSVTLARIVDGVYEELFRYEGPNGSLEITTLEGFRSFGHRELLLSYSQKLDNVKTLRVMNFDIYHDETFAATMSAMNNLISISFVGCPRFPRPLIPKDGLPVPLPHLKHISGLHPGNSLVELARARKGKGMPLSAVDVNGSPKDVETVYIQELREFVEVVKVWRCGRLPERWADNLVLNAWEGAGYDGPVSVLLVSGRCHTEFSHRELSTGCRYPAAEQIVVISTNVVEGLP